MKPNSKFTLLHRALHWTMAFALTILFITGFLRMTYMSKKSTAAIVLFQATDVSKEAAAAIAKAILAPMWQWHVVFAFIMVAAVLVRLGYMTFKGVRFTNPFQKNLPVKKRLQGLTYVFFYVCVLMSMVTGIIIKLGLFDEAHHTIEAVHKWGIYWVPVFVVLHLVGVVLAEHSDEKGITSKMIGGD